ncbi:hypothetical protein [Halococcus thailandensis]|uniref:Uncharacterized protein n=1 Tax=Halococcus thailandensis JCM 13552 TaxID=1227457 RepID=M0MSA9_9EURY|nr:hypothetical protein [Halococcus thailandensis]EMA48253.1 hypothetical protein C451_20552 [Halococcus thailandensis JCM 13552]
MAEWPKDASIDNERVVGIGGNPIARSVRNLSIPLFTGSHYFRSQVSRDVGDFAEFGLGGRADGLESTVLLGEIVDPRRAQTMNP